MNILHLTHTDIKADSRILKEMQSIAKSNKNYNVQGIGIDRREDRNSNSLEKINIYSLEIKTREWPIFPKLLKHFFILCEFYTKLLIRSLKLKPQIIHCHDELVLPVGVFVKILTNSKLVYDAHELESEKNGLTKSESRRIFFMENRVWRFIDKLIVVSPSIAKWYHEKVGIKDTTIVMNSPVFGKEKTSFDKSYLRKVFDIPPSSRIFIYIGGFTKGRGIESLIEIFTNKNLKSHIVFLGYGQLKDELLEASGININIHVHHAVPHESVIDIAKSADIGLCFIENVSLSDFFSLPNKLFEYAFSGIPVITSDFPDISSVVGEYGLGSCSSVDIENIFSTINKFEVMEELPEIKLEKLYDLSWAAQEVKLVKLYSELTEVKV
jgi:glycosyltransferase involved in cell wall biosynthesis